VSSVEPAAAAGDDGFGTASTAVATNISSDDQADDSSLFTPQPSVSHVGLVGGSIPHSTPGGSAATTVGAFAGQISRQAAMGWDLADCLRGVSGLRQRKKRRRGERLL